MMVPLLTALDAGGNVPDLSPRHSVAAERGKTHIKRQRDAH